MTSPSINWNELQVLAEELSEPGKGPGSASVVEWRIIERTLNNLLTDGDWQGVIRLRAIFNNLFARDTAGGLDILQKLDEESIKAARRINDKQELAHLLGAKGHNLHRQGYHQTAIEVFEESAALYRETGEPFESLKNYYMTSLCHRALDNRELAKQVLTNVLRQVDLDNPWRGNPLQVMAWLLQDDGQLVTAEQFMLEAIKLQEQALDPDILVAGSLTDLAEVVGLQGRIDEAMEIFHQSLTLLHKHEGQYDRQEARTTLKLAELVMRQQDYSEALSLLDRADDKIRGYGHYHDLMWRIELARAYIYLRQRRMRDAVRKFRAVRDFRRELSLSDFLLIRQLIGRLWAGTGLPR